MPGTVRTTRFFVKSSWARAIGERARDATVAKLRSTRVSREGSLSPIDAPFGGVSGRSPPPAALFHRIEARRPSVKSVDPLAREVAEVRARHATLRNVLRRVVSVLQGSRRRGRRPGRAGRWLLLRAVRPHGVAVVPVAQEVAIEPEPQLGEEGQHEWVRPTPKQVRCHQDARGCRGRKPKSDRGMGLAATRPGTDVSVLWSDSRGIRRPLSGQAGPRPSF